MIDPIYSNSKVSLLISWLYLKQLNRNKLLFSPDLDQRRLHIYVLLALTVFKYLTLFYRVDHFIWLLERRLCYTFFGGLHADLTKFCKRKPRNVVYSRHLSFAKFD